MLTTKQREQVDNSAVNHCLTQLNHSRGYTTCAGMEDPCEPTAFESHAILNGGAEKDPRWLYLGEKELESQAIIHSQANERQGFDDQEDPPDKFHCDGRERCLCCLLFFLVLLCSGLLAAYMALSSSSTPSMPWGRAPSLPWLPWGASPSKSGEPSENRAVPAGAPARAAVLPSAVVDSMSAEPFDCADQYYDWETLWDDNKKAWCCKHERKGCTKTSTSATVPPVQPAANSLRPHATSPSKTGPLRPHATNPSKTGPLRQPTSKACAASCTFDAQTAPCGQRVQFAAEFVFFSEADPCKEAHDMVLKECESCSSCMLDATGCDRAWKTFVRREAKFQR